MLRKMKVQWGSINRVTPIVGCFISWDILLKWRMTGRTTNLGHLHVRHTVDVQSQVYERIARSYVIYLIYTYIHTYTLILYIYIHRHNWNIYIYTYVDIYIYKYLHTKFLYRDIGSFKGRHDDELRALHMRSAKRLISLHLHILSSKFYTLSIDAFWSPCRFTR